MGILTLRTRRRFEGSTALKSAVCGAVLLAFAQTGAGAQTLTYYTPIGVQPSTDIYAAIAQNPEIRTLYPYQVTGQYRSMTTVGDSYADVGNSLRGNPYLGSPTNSIGRFSNLVNEVDALQYYLGILTSKTANYATGGATTGTNTNSTGALAHGLVMPGIVQEIAALTADGVRFGIDDLVNITTAGGNDPMTGMTTAQTVAYTLSDVQALVGLGARNIVITSSGNAAQFSRQVAALAPVAQAGTRIFFLDWGTLRSRIVANPGLYGFTNTSTPCSLSACKNFTLAEQNKYLMWDYSHLTTSAYAWIGLYEGLQVNAPSSINAQAELTQIGVQGFSGSLMGRLDAYRNAGPNAFANAYAADMPVKAKPKAISDQPWSVFLEGAYQAGKRSDSLFAFGYDYDIEGGTVGVQYQINPNFLVGVAFNGTTQNASLNQRQGHIDTDAYQFAGFASYKGPNLFADAVLSGGFNKYKMDRPGVFADQTANADGHDFAFAFRAGYLFDAGAFRIGPVTGLNYAKVSIDGYKEAGDYLLNQIVGEQDTDLFTGNAGVQIRLAQPYGACRFDPYLNITAEHEFTGDRTIVTWQESVAMLPIHTPIQGRGENTYGKVAGGFSTAIAGQLSGQLTGMATFGRDGGDDYGVSGGFKYQF
ncbi:autotransporter domain-containing protein [Xanthobacteraceae bacterium Astr-EGSB]|uniref:autotransporter domain-containing protein n=1 Tax=Astrobacterium formosum TaxID=3069710 RepID=UPI0027AFC83B|nr:autotransporter domain-containing protein [Xanthobacteraceae bacterium Astr-EGSB]